MGLNFDLIYKEWSHSPGDPTLDPSLGDIHLSYSEVIFCDLSVSFLASKP